MFVLLLLVCVVGLLAVAGVLCLLFVVLCFVG